MGPNDIVYNFRAGDELTPALRAIQGAMLQLSQQTAQLHATMTQLGTLIQQAASNAQAGVGATQNLSAAYLAMAQAIQQQTQAYAQAQAAALAYQQQQAEVAQATRQAGQAAQATNAIWSQMFTVAGGIGLATSIQQVVQELKDFIVSTVQISARLEQTRASFAAVAGSIQGGEQQFAFITRTAQRLGLDIFALGDSFKSLTAATRGTTLEGPRTEAIFTAIAQAMRVTGGSSAQLHSALLAIEQMISKGTVSMEELRRQLGNALPGAFSIAARSMSMTTQEFEKLVRSGGLIATDFIIPLTRQLEQEFGPGVARAAETASAAFAKFGNEVTLLKDRLGQSFLPVIKEVTNALTELMRKDREAIEAHERALGGAVPEVPAGAGPDIVARAAEITRARTEASALIQRQGARFEIFRPTEEDVAAAKARLARLLAEQRQAMLDWDRLMQADMPGGGAEALAGGAAITNVLRILKEGQAALKKIDVAGELEPGIDRAQEKVKSWLATIKAANAALTALPRVVLESITPDLRAGQRALGLPETIGGTRGTSAGDYPYKELIERISATRNLDPELIKTLISIESSFNPNARNPESSAKGLGQFTDATWKQYGPPGMVFDPQANITATVNYLADLLKQFGGNLRDALAAYGDKNTVTRVLGAYQGPGTAAAGTSTVTGAPLGAAGAYLDQLKAEVQLVKDLEKGDPEARSRTMATGGEYLRALDEEIKRHDDDVKSLERIHAAYTKTKEARDEDTVSLIAARNPQDADLRQKAQMLLSYMQLREEMLDSFTALKQRVDATRENEKAQEDYNKKLDDTIRLLQTPRTEKAEEQLRAKAPGGVVTPAQAGKLSQITALEKAADQAKEIEKIIRDLGRNIERGFTTVWENIMEGGITSFRSFGATVVRELRTMFSQLSSAIMNMLMDSIAKGMGGDTSGGAGWAGALAKILVNLGLSALGSSTGAGGGGGGTGAGGFDTGSTVVSMTPATAGATGGVFPSFGAFHPFALAKGGIVDRPAWALIGEQRGHNEAVVPLPDNRSIPVTMTGGSMQREGQPITIVLHVEPKNVIDPRALKSTQDEIVGAWASDFTNDGISRRVVLRHGKK